MLRDDLIVYFEWDVNTWSRALKLWNELIPKNTQLKALDIGARRGGLSLMLANEYNAEVVCSDVNNPMNEAKPLHDRYLKNGSITYSAVNCMEIPFEDQTFDIVIVKSVIGALGSFEKQQTAMYEIHRVLKPGGVLLFAENLLASPLHQFARNKFNRWSSYWRYPEIKDYDKWLLKFDNYNYKTTGYLATFVRHKWFRIIASRIDLVLEKITPRKYHYLIFGYAKK